MTISEQLEQLRDALVDWSVEIKGRVEIAADAIHLLGLLATSPGSPRIVIMFEGETKFGTYEELGKVDRKFMIIVSRGRGFQLDPAAQLIAGSGGGRPLYQLVEECREVLRGLVFDRETTNGMPDYLGTSRFAMEEAAIDAYQINLSILTQLPVHPDEN